MGRAKQIQMVVFGATIVALIAGAVAVAGAGSDPGARARELIASFHESGDAGALAARLAPGTVEGIPPDQVEAGLTRLLQEPFEPTATEVATVRGVSVARITTERVEWCVVGGRSVVIGCRIATVQLEGEVRGAPLELAFSAIDVFPDQLSLVVVVAPTGQAEVAVGSSPTLESPDGTTFDLVETSFVAGGQRVPAPPEDLTIPPGAALLLSFRASEVADLDGAVEGPFTVSWEGGGVDLEVVDVRWFVGPQAGPGGASPSPTAGG